MADSKVTDLPVAITAQAADVLYAVRLGTDEQIRRDILVNQITVTGIAAAGSTQGTATALTGQLNEVTTVGAGQGVLLYSPTNVGEVISVRNGGANALLVYPPSGGSIDALGANVGFSVPTNSTANFHASTTIKFYSEGLGSSIAIPVSVPNGGTGLTTLTANAVVIGNGASSPTFATIGTAGRALLDQGAGTPPTFNAISGDATLASNGVLTLASVGTPGLYGLVTTDAQGRVSSASTANNVAHGGTGVTTLTAYAVICGGTAATNPVQSIASVGTAGQVLTSNGAAALPTFQASPAGFSLFDTQTFTANGTWTKPSGAVLTLVDATGGGGQGGGGAGQAAAAVRQGGTGGGGGARSKVWFNSTDLAATETVVVGGIANAAGGGGSSGAGTNGTAGNNTSFGTTVKVWAFGGGGGTGAAAAGAANAGGGGGGVMGAGATGGSNNLGGAPQTQNNQGSSGGGGASGPNTGIGQPAEWGGASGGSTSATGAATGTAGGVSQWGGGGGGGGGGITTANAAQTGGAGGGGQIGTSGGGGAGGAGGATGTVGTAGAAGNNIASGQGGGGGGGSTAATGAVGGAGGIPGGAGGGGGGGTTVGGAGGSGARGQVIAYSYK